MNNKPQQPNTETHGLVTARLETTPASPEQTESLHALLLEIDGRLVDMDRRLTKIEDKLDNTTAGIERLEQGQSQSLAYEQAIHTTLTNIVTFINDRGKKIDRLLNKAFW